VAVLDFARVDNLRLRFPNRERADLVLSRGVHAVGHDADGEPCLVDRADKARIQFCVDRRGAWLQLREGARGLHVNGRPVRRMAMLRAGDTMHMDGVELILLGPSPRALPDVPTVVPDVMRHVVLRGVGGIHHGRCFNLDRPCVIGRLTESDVCIAEPGFADRHARLEPHPEGIVLRDLGSPGGSVVNGYQVREGLLLPGDQIVFGANQRFLLEAPYVSPVFAAAAPTAVGMPEAPSSGEPARSPVASSMRRMPWLLLAAMLLAGALALLLLYGAR
jgi:hypothetical protein